MWKKPRRNNTEISQTYNDGVVTVYSVADVAEPGRKPVEKLQEKVRLNYENRRMGIQRYYAGHQEQIEIKRVIRCQNHGKITNQDVAITEDGERYQVHLVQMVPDVYPASVDITLAQISQKYQAAEVVG